MDGSGGARARRLDVVVLVVLGSAVAVMAAAHAVVPNLPFAPALAEHDNEVRRFFEVAGEFNGWTWLNVVVLNTAALLYAVGGALARWAGRSVWPWAAWAALLAGLSLDDLTGLHERLHEVGVSLGGGSGLLRAAWIIPGVAVAVLLVVACVVLARQLPGRARGLLLVGLGLLLGGAIGLEAISQAVLDDVGPSAAYGVLVLVEELAEAWGAVLIAAAAAACLTVHSHDGAVTVRLVNQVGDRLRASATR